MKNIYWRISKIGLFCFFVVLVVLSIWGSQSDPTSKKPDIDGIIGKDEYEPAKIFKGSTGKKFTIYWKVVGPDIFIALEVETSGWVSIGIEPTDNLHKNADMIFGWVDDQGMVKVVDAFSPESQGPHPEDKELGGTTDIKLFGGSEMNGITTIEFVRPLITGDRFDNDIRRRTDTSIIWAYGDVDNWKAQHQEQGRASFNVQTGATSVPVTLWPFHALLMISGFSFIVAGAIVARKKEGTGWMKIHRMLVKINTLLILTGAIFGVSMIEISQSMHINFPHSYFGISIPVLTIIVLISGERLLKPNKGPKSKRKIHRVLAWMLISLMSITMIEGFFAAGIW
jgi:hypothetical protein